MRYNIGRLICVSFAIVLLLIALISGFSVMKLNDIVDTLHDIVKNNMATAHDMRRIRSQHMEKSVMFEKGLRYAEEFSVFGDVSLRGELEEAKKQFLEINKSSLDIVSQVIDRLSGLLEESMSGGRNIEYWVGSAHKEVSSIKISLGAYGQAVEDVFESILSQKWDPDSDESIKLMLKVGGEQMRLDESFHRVIEIFEAKIKMETTLAEKDAISSIKMIAAVTVLSVFSLVLLFMLLLKKTYSMGQSIEENIELKDALAKLSDELRNESELTLLLDRVLSFLAQQIDAKVQAFYIVSEGRLTLSASYAYMKRKNLSNEFAFGEGLVGQCAKEKKIIHISQVPDDYVRICSGTGEALAREIICFPILYEKKLLGVLEIATFDEICDKNLKFLKEGVRLIAVALNSVLIHKEQKILLDQTLRNEVLIKQNNEELMQQKEELKSTNDALNEQRVQLIKSEEDLKLQGEELRAANEELEEKQVAIKLQTVNLEKAKKELEDKAQELTLANKYKSEFLANMSHELRTPLNSMLILSKDLADNKKGNLTSQQQQDAEFINEGGKELLNLINDILDLSKVEAGKLDITMEKVLLKQIAKNLKFMFLHQCKKKKIALKVHIDETLPEVIRSDGQRVEQILKNFMSNALKFTSKGSITLSIHPIDRGVVFNNRALIPESTVGFSVIDTGIGIPKDKQSAIFEAFRQQDGSTSRKYGGTGLGLTISKEFAQLLGGEINLKSNEGEGSTFSLYLPAATDLQESSNNAELMEANTRSEKLTADFSSDEDEHKNPRNIRDAKNIKRNSSIDEDKIVDDRRHVQVGEKSILIIEDDNQFLRILSRYARDQGFKVLVADRGRDGVLLAVEHNPTGIILDLGLPDIDGQDVLDQLKFNLKTRHIPVHVMSGREGQNELLSKGALGFLKKPVDEKAIQSVLETIEKVDCENSQKEILVVEDDAVAQESIRRLIEAPGIRITCSNSEREAIEKLSETTYDCIVLDLGLPDSNGIDAVKNLHDKIGSRNTPIIIYTGRDVTAQEHRELNELSSSIVIKGAESPERLLDDVSLFLHQVGTDLSKEQSSAIDALHDENCMLRGRRVLLVDDDMRNIYALTGKLKEAGLDVSMAEHGEAALRKIEENAQASNPPFEIILMDIMMPVMDGYEAMQRIREIRDYRETPILALTAKAMPGDRRKCIDAGASDYVTKPIDVEKLYSMLRVWLYRC